MLVFTSFLLFTFLRLRLLHGRLTSVVSRTPRGVRLGSPLPPPPSPPILSPSLLLLYFFLCFSLFSCWHYTSSSLLLLLSASQHLLLFLLPPLPPRPVCLSLSPPPSLLFLVFPFTTEFPITYGPGCYFASFLFFSFCLLLSLLRCLFACLCVATRVFFFSFQPLRVCVCLLIFLLMITLRSRVVVP